MTIRRRQSLEAKLSYLTIGLVFALVLGLGHFTLKQQRTALMEAKAESFQNLAQVLAVALKSTLQQGLIDQSQDVARSLHNTHSELEYILVTDHRGSTVFAEFRRHSSANNPEFAGIPARRILNEILGDRIRTEASIYRVDIPVTLADGQMGSVQAGFSMSDVNTLMDISERTLLVWFAAAFIAGIIGSVMLARSISSQITTLSQAARKVAEGDLGVQIDVNCQDEIGELTDTFNRMVVQLKEHRTRLEQRANTDSLTGLYNHRFFQERLAEEIRRADRHQRDVSLLILDLDHFKTFNDTHGHPNGDTAIEAVSEILKASVRDIDVVGRYGGEEFAVIIPECSVDEAVKTAERIRTNIQRHCFFGKDEQPVPMTVSVGVASYPHHSQEREGLIFAADIALYQSKSLGRNRVTVYSGDTHLEDGDAPYRFFVALHATDMSTVESLAEAIDAKHRHPLGFSKSVADLAVSIGKELGMRGDELDSIRIAGLLRDIGQIGIPDEVLNKVGGLTDEERRLLESHPSLGHSIIEQSPHFKAILPGILHHHERWDGKGYPFGLAGEDIPVVARIVALADSYRAMTVDRPHRPSMTPPDALTELEQCAGTQFDPEIVSILLRIEKDRNIAQAA